MGARCAKQDHDPVADDIAVDLVDHAFVTIDDLLHPGKVGVEDRRDLGGPGGSQLLDDLVDAVEIGKDDGDGAELAARAAGHAGGVEPHPIEQARRQKGHQGVQPCHVAGEVGGHGRDRAARRIRLPDGVDQGLQAKYLRVRGVAVLHAGDEGASVPRFAHADVLPDGLIGRLVHENLTALGLVFGVCHVGQRLAHDRVLHLVHGAQVGREQRP